MNLRCFKVHPGDNVATLLDDVTIDGGSGNGSTRTRVSCTVLGCAAPDAEVSESMHLGHKVALCDIPEGQPVIKFGETIGLASKSIAAGQWVHLHNTESLVDERSQTLDPETGSTTDTRYE